MPVRIVGFNAALLKNIQKPKPPLQATYQSQSRGNVLISNMNSKHLFNAFKKHFLAALEQSLRQTHDFYELEKAVENASIEEIVQSNSTLYSLYLEINRRDSIGGL